MHITTISSKDFVEGKTFEKLRTKVIENLVDEGRTLKEINTEVKKYNKEHFGDDYGKK